jgi:hypothetical protein
MAATIGTGAGSTSSVTTARGLYERLGFERVAEYGVYLRMELAPSRGAGRHLRPLDHPVR